MPSEARKRESRAGDSRALGVKAAVKIVRGVMVVLQAGWAVTASAAAGLVAVGVSDETVDNTGGANGDKLIKVDRRVFVLENDTVAPVTRAHIGSDCYILDDITVTSDNTGTSVAGRVFDVDARGVSVEFY